MVHCSVWQSVVSFLTSANKTWNSISHCPDTPMSLLYVWNAVEDFDISPYEINRNTNKKNLHTEINQTWGLYISVDFYTVRLAIQNGRCEASQRVCRYGVYFYALTTKNENSMTEIDPEKQLAICPLSWHMSFSSNLSLSSDVPFWFSFLMLYCTKCIFVYIYFWLDSPYDEKCGFFTLSGDISYQNMSYSF